MCPGPSYPMLRVPPLVLSVITGALASGSGVLYFATVSAATSDTGLAVAAAITGLATIVAAVAACINTWMLTRVQRQTHAVREVAREGVEQLRAATDTTDATDADTDSL